MKLIIDISDDLYKTKMTLPEYMCGIFEKTVKSGVQLEQIKSEIKNCLWKLSEGNTYLDITREEVENAILEILDKYKPESEE